MYRVPPKNTLPIFALFCYSKTIDVIGMKISAISVDVIESHAKNEGEIFSFLLGENRIKTLLFSRVKQAVSISAFRCF